MTGRGRGRGRKKPNTNGSVHTIYSGEASTSTTVTNSQNAYMSQTAGTTNIVFNSDEIDTPIALRTTAKKSSTTSSSVDNSRKRPSVGKELESLVASHMPLLEALGRFAANLEGNVEKTQHEQQWLRKVEQLKEEVEETHSQYELISTTSSVSVDDADELAQLIKKMRKQSSKMTKLSYQYARRFSELAEANNSSVADNSRYDTGTSASASSADGVVQFIPPAVPAIYRNQFSIINFHLPAELANQYDNVNVFVDRSIGYSGNATRFRDQPRSGERALLVSVQIRNSQTNEVIQQCAQCNHYFLVTKKYFKQNPEMAHKVLLVKNSENLYVRNGHFHLAMKLMCCSNHHDDVDFNFFVEIMNEMSQVVFRTVFVADVKQWKKGSVPVSECTVLLFDAMNAVGI